MAIDHVLKLYSETIQSSYLHYGFWDDPNAMKLELMTLQNIKDAQNRYIEHLASYIPDDVKNILDVGCGIGGNTKFLLDIGYEVEALSPDDFQKDVIGEKFSRAPLDTLVISKLPICKSSKHCLSVPNCSLGYIWILILPLDSCLKIESI